VTVAQLDLPPRPGSVGQRNRTRGGVDAQGREFLLAFRDSRPRGRLCARRRRTGRRQVLALDLAVAAEANAPLTVTEPRRACRIRTATLCMILSELVGEGRVRRTPAGYLPAGW